MDSILNFDDIFSDLQPGSSLISHERVSTHVPDYSHVPEAPSLTSHPDLDSLLDHRDDSLLGLSASQWMPKVSQKSTQGESRTFQDQLFQDKLDEDENIYLGSQFPLVQKVAPSQARHLLDRSHTEKNVGSSSWKSKLGASADDNSAILTLKSTNAPNKPIVNRGFRTPYTTGNTTDTGRPIEMKQAKNTAATPRDQLWTPAAIILPQHHTSSGVKLRSVDEIPATYRQLFNFRYFNIVQSRVFDDVVYTDKSLVLCSPTGSGKTAVFEMAIVRLLTHSKNTYRSSFKVVYSRYLYLEGSSIGPIDFSVAPIKALCSERFKDWQTKFEPLGISLMELTGDTDTDNFYELQQVNVILTTPEKWDSMTRRWRDNKAVMQAICLFLIDEIHILNDPTRGATVEAVLSRMKTIQAARSRAKTDQECPPLRFLALSATITNIEDISEWLSSVKTPAVHYK